MCLYNAQNTIDPNKNININPNNIGCDITYSIDRNTKVVTTVGIIDLNFITKFQFLG